MGRFNLYFETYSSERIGKDHYKLYTTVCGKTGNFAIVECDYIQGSLCNFKFWDRDASLAEIKQAKEYFEFELHHKAFPSCD